MYVSEVLCIDLRITSWSMPSRVKTLFMKGSMLTGNIIAKVGMGVLSCDVANQYIPMLSCIRGEIIGAISV